jgi:hypothetical protein
MAPIGMVFLKKSFARQAELQDSQRPKFSLGKAEFWEETNRDIKYSHFFPVFFHE